MLSAVDAAGARTSGSLDNMVAVARHFPRTYTAPLTGGAAADAEPLDVTRHEVEVGGAQQPNQRLVVNFD